MSTVEHFRKEIDALREFHRNRDRGKAYDGHGFVTAEPLAEREICRIEEEHQLVFPTEYREFLKVFGDGRVGPRGFIPVRESITRGAGEPFPLLRPFLGVESPAIQAMSETERWNPFKFLSEQWDAIPKDHGVVRIADYGCGLHAMLILNGAFAGNVWMLSGDAAYYGPYGGSEALHDESAPCYWEPTHSPREYSFFEWYESWLNGELKQAALKV